MAPLKPRRPRGGQQRVSAAGPARAPAPASTCGPRARHPPPPPLLPPPPPPRPGSGPLRPAPARPAPRPRPRPRPPSPGTPALPLWASLRARARRAGHGCEGRARCACTAPRGPSAGPGTGAGGRRRRGRSALWMATETARRACGLGTSRGGRASVKFLDSGRAAEPLAPMSFPPGPATLGSQTSPGGGVPEVMPGTTTSFGPFPWLGLVVPGLGRVLVSSNPGRAQPWTHRVS